MGKLIEHYMAHRGDSVDYLESEISYLNDELAQAKMLIKELKSLLPDYSESEFVFIDDRIKHSNENNVSYLKTVASATYFANLLKEVALDELNCPF